MKVIRLIDWTGRSVKLNLVSVHAHTTPHGTWGPISWLFCGWHLHGLSNEITQAYRSVLHSSRPIGKGHGWFLIF